LIRAPIPSGAVLPDLIHVPTSASTSALQQISPNLQLGVPILLASPTSSGKTHILHYLSSQLYPSQQPTNPILTIPLADTTIDVKSLIGTYISSQTKPGTFEWMEGALAKAVRAGRWVVFDDIDRASLEMLVTVAGLTRSLTRGRAGRRATLAVPGRDTIEAGEGFAIFATRTTRQEATATSSFFGNHNFTEITLNGPTDDDILAILSAKFKQLPSSVITISIDVWSELRPVAKVGGHVKGRDIGLRDLEKWCARVQRNLPPLASLAALERAEGSAFANPVFQDEVLLEAADMFLAALDNKPQSIEVKVRAMRIITEKVGMDNERAIALLNIRKPQLETSPRSRQLRIGRTSLPVASSDPRDFPSSQRPFAVTRPSLVLLERIAVAGNMGEPVLLVGETGTGKTTAVQFIANACRKPLSVLNLSTQTESSDLLGGYKPLDAAISAPALHARWQKLFCDTFSMAKPQNGVYLEAVSRALNGRRWDRCADLWAQSARRAVEKLSKQDAYVLRSRSTVSALTPRSGIPKRSQARLERKGR
jgi:midasin